MPRRKTSLQLDKRGALELLAAGLVQQATEPNIYAYRPHAKQEIFHKADKHVRLYIGGNRSGKTVGGVVEDIYWLKQQHPFRKLPEGQIRGRVHTVDFLNGFEKIIQPQFKRWMPPSLLINGSWEDSFSKQDRVLTCSNGNTVEFMSYDQDLDKFAGTSRHFCHYDEEPPQHIFNESQARLIDTDGYAWLTMTPIDGMTWVYHELYTPGTNGDDEDVAVIEVDMAENPYVGETARKRYLKTLDKDERNAREHGHFVQLGGRVFKAFDKDIHVVPDFIPPTSWEWYVSIDHGYNNPTAMLWHAVSPDNQVVTFSEHYASEMLVKEHAGVYHARNAGMSRIPDYTVGDPAMEQRQGVTGISIFQEYADNGVYIMAGNNDVPSGVNKMNQYLKPDHNGKPQWTITESCVNLIREMKLLRWATYASRKMQYENNKHEKIHKKDDHAPDSARYFFSFMPDLTPFVDEPQGLIRTRNPEGSVGGVLVGGTYDEVLRDQARGVSKPAWKMYEGTDLYSLEGD
jgi:phage terminase large subunit-like protein